MRLASNPKVQAIPEKSHGVLGSMSQDGSSSEAVDPRMTSSEWT